MTEHTDNTLDNADAVSELVDARLGSNEAAEVLAQLSRDPALLRRWRNFQLTGMALQRHAARDETPADEGFVSSVMQRIRDEERKAGSGNVVQFPSAVAPVDVEPAAEFEQDAGRVKISSWLPLAAAASVTAIAVTLWALLPQLQLNADPELQAAQPAELVATAAPEARTLHIPVSRPRAVQQLGYADNAQLNAYLLTHSNQGSTNLGGALGLVRVAAHTQSGR